MLEPVSFVAFYVKGDHAFFVGCPKTKEHMAKMQLVVPGSAPTEVIAVQSRRCTNAAADWTLWDGTVKPGHFHCDLTKARLKLHEQNIAPRVCLTASGALRRLVYHDLTLHTRPPEWAVCIEFARVYEEVFGSAIVYGGESLASFCARVFADLCKPADRPVRDRHVVFFSWRSSAASARPVVRT